MNTFKSEIRVSDYFNLADMVTLSTTLLAILAILFLVKKRENNAKFEWIDYILMGRKLSLPFFVATIVSTWYGGIFGVTRIAFDNGIYNFVTQGFFWYLSYIVFALFIVNKARATEAITLGDLVKKQFGPKAGVIAGFFNFFNVVPIVYCISLSLILQSVLPLNQIEALVSGTTLVVLYSSFGGFKTVVYTDFLQFIIMFAAVLLVLFLSIAEFGGLKSLQAGLPESYFDPSGGYGWGETLAWGLIAMSTLVDPNFYHRAFAAKSDKVAKYGILLACVFWCIFDIATTFGAMYAKLAMPLANSETAYFHYAIQIVPAGFRGLFLGGLIACILSTMDSYIFTASNTLVYDILPGKLYQKKRYHILAGFFVGALAVLMALAFDGNIKSVWKTLGSYSAACLLFPVAISLIFSIKFSDKAFLFSCIASAAGVTYWRNFPAPQSLEIVDDLYIGILLSAAVLFFSKFPKQKYSAST
ncbi:MAG: sodium:solute symporter [Bdellovibrionales bacterium]